MPPAERARVGLHTEPPMNVYNSVTALGSVTDFLCSEGAEPLVTQPGNNSMRIPKTLVTSGALMTSVSDRPAAKLALRHPQRMRHAVTGVGSCGFQRQRSWRPALECCDFRQIRERYRACVSLFMNEPDGAKAEGHGGIREIQRTSGLIFS